MNITKEIQPSEVENVLNDLIESLKTDLSVQVAVDAAVSRLMILLELENKRGVLTGCELALDHLRSQSKQRADESLEKHRVKLAQDLS